MSNETRVVPVEPSDADISRMVDAFYASNGDVKQDMRAVYAAAIAARPPIASNGVEGVPPLDDPRLQELFSSTTMGAMMFGAQNANPPPDGHWLTQFWELGRSTAQSPPAQDVVRDAERWRKLCALMADGKSVLTIDGGPDDAPIETVYWGPETATAAIDAAREVGNG